MPRLTLRDGASIDSQIRRVISQKMARVFKRADFLLTKQAEVLQQQFRNSDEFRDLSGRLKGEFGFTDQEIAQLDRILSLLVPGSNDITVSVVKTGAGRQEVFLDWVDFEKLKVHEFAQHALTKLDEAGRVVQITDIISWVEWLEEGASIRGFQFFRPGAGGAQGGSDPAAFSRSGEGLMRRSNSNFWTFEPTRVFERISKQEEGDDLRRGFGVLVRREIGGDF